VPQRPVEVGHHQLDVGHRRTLVRWRRTRNSARSAVHVHCGRVPSAWVATLSGRGERHPTTPEDHMPGQAPPLTEERELLLAFLAQQRDGIRYAVHGLTDEQARRTPTAGSLSAGGLLRHVTDMERSWIEMVAAAPGPAPAGDADAYVDNFTFGPDGTIADALAALDAQAAETERVVRSVADLADPVPVPRGVPWYPDDIAAWSVRWVLLHLVEELARHAGHADIVRESIDGATMYELMAAAEGWPATDWLQPWEPPVEVG
jgi:uncharacterized damage-inducible protein DinB